MTEATDLRKLNSMHVFGKMTYLQQHSLHWSTSVRSWWCYGVSHNTY